MVLKVYVWDGLGLGFVQAPGIKYRWFQKLFKKLDIAGKIQFLAIWNNTFAFEIYEDVWKGEAII